MRDLEIDVAIDLSGLTASCRPGILCFRPAPVQVNYLGYAETMGSRRYDYILADETVIPQQDLGFYDEHIAVLPRPFLPIDAVPPAPSAAVKSRSDAGLPGGAFVFASFNNSIKFNPPVFDIWMRLLRSIDGSVLWLPAANPTAVRNLASEGRVHHSFGNQRRSKNDPSRYKLKSALCLLNRANATADLARKPPCNIANERLVVSQSHGGIEIDQLHKRVFLESVNPLVKVIELKRLF